MCCFPVITFLRSRYIFSSSLLRALFHDFLAGLDCPRILWAALDLERLSSFPEPCFLSSRDVLKTVSCFWHTLYLSGRQRYIVEPDDALEWLKERKEHIDNKCNGLKNLFNTAKRVFGDKDKVENDKG